MTRNLILTIFVFSLGIAFSIFTYMGVTKVQTMMTRIEPAAGEAAISTTQEPQSEFVIGGAFEMTDENGNIVTDQNFSDHYKLVFFGFTKCPDVCPAGMQKMTKTMEKLGDDAAVITPVFVSIDPRRDTPDVMKEYTDMYDPRIVGLTGDEKQVQAMEEKFKVYASKIASDKGEEFAMFAHSAYIYLTDKNNHMLTVFGHDDLPEDMAAEIKAEIKKDQNAL